MLLAEISDKIYHCMKLFHRHYFSVNMVTCHGIVLAPASVCAAHHPSFTVVIIVTENENN
jgi:hypothetical protein